MQVNKTVRTPTTEAVTAAFALGWQMARLYGGQLSSNAEPRLDEDLPGLSKLPAASLVTLGLAQADAGIERLDAFLKDRTTLPTTEAARAEIARERPDRDAIRKAILNLHVGLLITLTAGDYKLGKAYGLGRALADTCVATDPEPSQRKKALEHHLQPDRAQVLTGWMDDLKTVLPTHSAQDVIDALGCWVRWAQDADVTTFNDEKVRENTRALHSCGQRWRAVLSGEKNAKDLLMTNDYVSASRRVLARVGTIARSLARQLAVPLAGTVALVGAGVTLMFLNNGTAQVLAGLGTVVGGLGITWRSAANSFGRVSLDLGRPLWEAELDIAVGNRLTPTPQREYMASLKRPNGRVRRAWREFRTPDVDIRRGTRTNAAGS